MCKNLSINPKRFKETARKFIDEKGPVETYYRRKGMLNHLTAELDSIDKMKRIITASIGPEFRVNHSEAENQWQDWAEKMLSIDAIDKSEAAF
jgi:hypothetical protein